MHPPTLKGSGSNPPGGKMKNIFLLQNKHIYVFISINYDKNTQSVKEKELKVL
jgi:hypothetical protein